MPKPLNYTTTIKVQQTVAEVQALLAEHGASAVATKYEAGVPVGMTFGLTTDYGERAFELPVDAGAMHRALLAAERRGEFRSTRKAAGTFTRPEHAARVAWRVVKDWLEAQLALVAAGQAKVDQVMLPYMQVDGQPLYLGYVQQQQAAIESGTGRYEVGSDG